MEESPTAGPNLGLAYLSLLYAVVVMANLQALLAVETGTLTPPRWQLEVRRCRPHCNRFEAQVLLARYLAQPPGEVARYLDTAAGPQRTIPIY